MQLTQLRAVIDGLSCPAHTHAHTHTALSNRLVSTAEAAGTEDEQPAPPLPPTSSVENLVFIFPHALNSKITFIKVVGNNFT